MLADSDPTPCPTPKGYRDSARKWLVRCLVVGFSAGYLLHLSWLQNGALLLFLLLVLPHEYKAFCVDRFSPSIALTISWCVVLFLFGLAIVVNAGRTIEVVLLVAIWALIAAAGVLNS